MSLRESIPNFRGRVVRAARASPVAMAAPFLLAVVAGVILSIVGAFDLEHRPFGARTGTVVVICCLCAGLAVGCRNRLSKIGWFSVGRWRLAIGTAVVATLPIGLAVWTIEGFLTRQFTPGDLVVVLPAALVLTLALCLVAALLRPPLVHVAVGSDFSTRFPRHLRGAELWAVEAEDHYLRLHTSKGDALILMRLTDAVGELKGVDGMQVHRSWWVARGAVQDIRRRGRGAELLLKGGTTAPVSRAYASALRSRRWF